MATESTSVQLLITLLRPIRHHLTVAVLASALAGVASMALLALINRALTADVASLPAVGAQFAAASLIALFCRWLSEERFARLGQDTLARLRVDVSRQIAALPYRSFEQRGAPHFNGLLTEDASAVAHCCTILPGVIINFFLMLGSFAYMASLSLSVFGLVLGVLVVGVLAYALVESFALTALRAARSAEDDVFKRFGGLLEGAKELRLHAARRSSFLSQGLARAVEHVRALRSRGLSISIAASSVGAFLFFVVIGVVAFVLSPAWRLPPAVVSGYALVFLYLMFPLESLLGSLPTLERGRIALERLAELVAQADPGRQAAVASSTRTALPAHPFTSLRLEGVTHSYRRENEPGEFVLGPIDLELSSGELTFLIGGNGSGKTTLAKLLVGLYSPERGRVLLNGVELSDATRDLHREMCSAVFSDFHLFEALWGLDDEHVPREARAWLERLQLSERVQIEGDRFSTTALSQGQKKRLALVVSCLERRPVILFDEWAADQDPPSKDVFYRELLPALRRLGKAVVVVTHDERYFELADRCLKLEYGRLVPLTSVGDARNERRPHPHAASARAIAPVPGQ